MFYLLVQQGTCIQCDNVIRGTAYKCCSDNDTSDTTSSSSANTLTDSARRREACSIECQRAWEAQANGNALKITATLDGIKVDSDSREASAADTTTGTDNDSSLTSGDTKPPAVLSVSELNTNRRGEIGANNLTCFVCIVGS